MEILDDMQTYVLQKLDFENIIPFCPSILPFIPKRNFVKIFNISLNAGSLIDKLICHEKNI
jgi:hypothetical protein